MKYFNIKSFNSSIHRIIEGGVTHKYRTGTVATGLSEVYFPVTNFAKTPEEIKEFTKKRPDISIEKIYREYSILISHVVIQK